MFYFQKVYAHFYNLKMNAEINNINFTRLDGLAGTGSGAGCSRSSVGAVKIKTNS